MKPADGATRHAVGVHILLTDSEGRFLLQLRSQTVELAPGWWSTPRGNLEAENATLREQVALKKSGGGGARGAAGLG